jgi:hypothetical protein
MAWLWETKIETAKILPMLLANQMSNVNFQSDVRNKMNFGNNVPSKSGELKKFAVFSYGKSEIRGGVENGRTANSAPKTKKIAVLPWLWESFDSAHLFYRTNLLLLSGS